MLVSFFDEQPLRPLDLDDYCNYVEECIQLVEAKEVIVVGHSFGGRVGLRLAVRRVIDKLVLVDSAGLKPRRSLSYYYKVYSYKAKRKLGLDTSGSGSSDYRSMSPIMKRTFVTIVGTFQDFELEHVHIPTLIIWGDMDRETPMYMAKKLIKKIKDNKIIVYEGAGHFSYLERPELFERNLRSFCN